MTYGGTYSEQRYSTLAEITTANVAQLGLAWFADYDTNLQQEGTPLYIDGVIYVSTAWSKLYAFDARTGKELWKYDSRVPGEWAVNVCCGLVNRGIAAYNGKIFMGTLDGRLVAVDAATGAEVWSVMTVDQNERYSITGAPRVVKGRVLIGDAGRHELQKRVLAGLGRIDLQALVGDLAQICLDAVFGQAGKALVEIADRWCPSPTACRAVVEEELDARAVRDHDELQLEACRTHRRV